MVEIAERFVGGVVKRAQIAVSRVDRHLRGHLNEGFEAGFGLYGGGGLRMVDRGWVEGG